jgi:hypothetical protein
MTQLDISLGIMIAIQFAAEPFHQSPEFLY